MVTFPKPKTDTDFFEVVDASNPSSFLLGCHQSRQKEANEKYHHGNDNEDFHQCQCMVSSMGEARFHGRDRLYLLGLTSLKAVYSRTRIITTTMPTPIQK